MVVIIFSQDYLIHNITDMSIENPETNRIIKIGGPTHRKLIREGKLPPVKSGNHLYSLKPGDDIKALLAQFEKVLDPGFRVFRSGNALVKKVDGRIRLSDNEIKRITDRAKKEVPTDDPNELENALDELLKGQVKTVKGTGEYYILECESDESESEDSI